MTLTDEELGHLMETAQRLVEPVSGLSEILRTHLDDTGAVLDYTTSRRPDALSAACVDGAVADHQTDSLVWLSAVGVAQTDGRPEHAVAGTAVAPVSGDTDRLRAALMATCELSAATAWDDRMVFMDGGLATPLISVAQGLTVTDPDVADSVERHYRDAHLLDVVHTYLDRLLDGRIAALPKQDTATGYIGQFATALRGSLSDQQRRALQRMRDRPLVGTLMWPGEMLRPRPAAELARTEAKAPEDNPATAALDDAYGRLRAATGVHVAYFKPTRLPTRVIKIEYLESDTTSFSDGLALAALLDAQTLGPRMKEPLMQHQVDQAAKRLVTANLSTITGTAARALEDQAATDHYRT
ncbi:MAG: hypothetical protein L0H93_07550 [Nocardioides sp.]|nr:hypothetical protein [Nocardioides sp.]